MPVKYFSVLVYKVTNSGLSRSIGIQEQKSKKVTSLDVAFLSPEGLIL